MEDIKPKATAEQEFVLMLHDRLVALEALVDSQKKEIDDLRKQVSAYKLMYNLSDNVMSDGGSVEWDITTDPSKMKIIYFRNGRSVDVTKFHLDAPLCINGHTFDRPEEITVLLPVQREGCGVFPIKFVVSEMTLGKFANIVYEFYHKKITKDYIDFADSVIGNDEPQIIQYFREKMDASEEGTLTWIDLMYYKSEDIRSIMLLQMNSIEGMYNFELYIC